MPTPPPINNRRSIITQTEDSTLITIPANKKKLPIIFIWLIGWTICGLFAIANYGIDGNGFSGNLKIFVWLIFWAIGILAAIYGILWRFWGKEIIHIDQQHLIHKRKLGSIGRQKTYLISKIYKPQMVPLSSEKRPKRITFEEYKRQFGNRGLIMFDYEGNMIKMIEDIERQEAEFLLAQLKNVLTDNI